MATQPAFLYAAYHVLASVTASSSALGSSASDILAPTEDTGHRFASNGTHTITIDTFAGITADCFALAGTALDAQPFILEGSDDNSAWTEIIDTTLVAPARAAWVSFDSCTWRYWRQTLTDAPSNLEIVHACPFALAPWPYVEEDWDAGNLVIEGEQLVSASGYSAGGVVQSALRKMPITPGSVSAGELVPIAAFAAAVIRYQRGCFFVPQIGEDEIYFGWMADKKFSAPLENGLYRVDAFTFITRAD